MTKSKNILRPRTKWTEDMDATLRKYYPDIKAKEVAEMLQLPIHVIFKRAATLKLSKSDAFVQKEAERIRTHPVAIANRFKPGHTTFNKGKKGWYAPGTEATRFKPGQLPPNRKEVGATRICSKDGYILVKVGHGLRTWKLLHKVIYERMHGPVPDTHVITFVDGNKLNVSITNLWAITKSENSLRNSVHAYGPEIAHLYILKGAIMRQINKKEKAQNE